MWTQVVPELMEFKYSKSPSHTHKKFYVFNKMHCNIHCISHPKPLIEKVVILQWYEIIPDVSDRKLWSNFFNLTPFHFKHLQNLTSFNLYRNALLNSKNLNNDSLVFYDQLKEYEVSIFIIGNTEIILRFT